MYLEIIFFLDENRKENVSQSRATLTLDNVSAAAAAISQQLSALKVSVATFVFYAILHRLCSTPSLFKGHVKIVLKSFI